jgi:hypothetical protein
MEDWVYISAALALGAGVFILIFHLLAWLAGWPGPFLWFGTESRISDVLTAAGAILVSTFLLNLFGAACFQVTATLFRRLRGKRN